MNYKVINKPGDNSRYVVIDGESGEIIDDANGYGYKSAQNAHRCMCYKINSVNNKEFSTRYNKLFKTYSKLKSLQNDYVDWVFYSLKDGETISKPHAKNKILLMLKEELPELREELEKDINFKKYFLSKIT